MPELCGTAGLIQSPECPLRQLVEAILLAPDLQSPRLLRGRGWEAELRKGNAHLRGPAERVNGGLYFPNRIPGVVAPAAEAVGVHLHARRIRLEKQATDVIVIRIEDHFDVIGVHVGVT